MADSQDHGLALLASIFQWSDWCFRRVDSIHLQDGNRSRQRHSMDCMPPPLPELAYYESERTKGTINDLVGPICVPLALIKKGPMRQFDSTANADQPLPILGMNETTRACVDAIRAGFSAAKIDVTPQLSNALEVLVGPRAQLEKENVESLLAQGTWNGEKLFEVEDVPGSLMDLLNRLVSEFLLVALLPAQQAGVRQVLKFSFYTSIDLDRPPLLGRVQVAAGARSLKLSLVPVMPSATKSYHLEFNTPPELECLALVLDPETVEVPQVGRDQEERDVELNDGRYDVTGSPAAHVYGSFHAAEIPQPVIYLGVPKRGIWSAALASIVLTAGILWASIFFPGAEETLVEAPEGATALFLAVPAVLVGYLAMRTEHRVTSYALLPLRWMMVISALSIFLMAASIVGSLNEPYLSLLWRVLALVNSAPIFLLGFAGFASRVGRSV